MNDDVSVKFGADASEVSPAAQKAVDEIKRVAAAAADQKGSLDSYAAAWDNHNKSFINAWNDSTKAVTKSTDAFRLNRAQVQELTSIARHSFDQIAAGGSVFTTVSTHAASLAQVVGAGQGGLAGGFKLLAGAVGPAVGVLGGIVTIVGVGVSAFAAYQRAIAQATEATLGAGRASGISVTAFENIAEAAAKSGHASVQGARDSEAALLRTGQVSGAVIPAAVNMMEDFAAVTGLKAPAAAHKLAEALADPAKGAAELTAQFHFLDDQTVQLIKDMVEQGDKEGAQRVLTDALGNSIQGAADKTDIWGQAFKRLGRAAADAFTMIGRGLNEAYAFVSGDPHMFDGPSEYMVRLNKEAGDYRDLTRQAGDAARSLLPQQAQIHTITNQIALIRKASAEGAISEAEATKAIAQGERQIHDLKVREGRVGSAGQHHARGGSTLLAQAREELAAQLADEANFARRSEDITLEFWQSKLGAAKKGSRDAIAIQTELSRAELAVAKKDSAEFKKRTQDEFAFLDELRREEVAKRGLQIENQTAMERSGAQTRIEIARQEAQQELDAIDFKERAGILTATAAADQRTKLNDRLRQLSIDEAEAEYQITKQSLEDRLAIQWLEAPERERLNAELERLAKEHADRMAAIQAGNATGKKSDANNKDAAKLGTAHGWIDPFVQSWTRGIDGLVKHTATLRQALLGMFDSVFQVGLQKLGQFVANWIAKQLVLKTTTAAVKAAEVGIHTAGEAAKTAATVAGVTTRTGVEIAGAATSKSITIGDALMSIGASAAKAAAGAWAAISGIPVIGPFLAPAIAAAALVGVLALGKSLFSAKDGWGEVPYDGALTQLHKGEMVLPAPIASPLRKALSGGQDDRSGAGLGGSGNDVHQHTWNVQAIDARSFRRFLQGPAGKQMVEELFYRFRMGAAVGRAGLGR